MRRVKPRGLRTSKYQDMDEWLEKNARKVPAFRGQYTREELAELRVKMARAYLKKRSVDRARRELGLSYDLGRWLVFTAGIQLEGRGAGAYWYTELLADAAAEPPEELSEEEKERLRAKARALREEGLI